MPTQTAPRGLRMYILLGALGVLVASAPAEAQYFGQNKVRYEAPRFRVLNTEHFDVYYCDEESRVVADAAAMAERWYARLSRVLDHTLSRRQPLILYPSHPAFEQTNAIAGELGEGVGGVTESFKRRIVLPLGASLAETDHVIGHELVHAFQYDMAGTGRSLGLAGGGMERLPLWFIEGMAEYLSVGADDPHTAMWIRDAAVTGRLPSYGKLSDPRYFPYRYGQALWCYIAARYGDAAVARVYKSAATSGDPRTALRDLGVGADTLITDWHAAIRAWNQPVAAATVTPARQGQPLVVEKGGAGRLSLAPVLSPDGERLVFFSARSRFAIEMYVADARTGRVERQITKTVIDPHYQNLGFIASSGAWSPDGGRFAFGAVSRGRPVISIRDMTRGRTVREQRFEGLGEIHALTWSPDGHRIAFSALADGATDLWVLDTETGRARRLTDDRHADLQPAWSPDGGRIAFVTDRFGAGDEHGDYRLALIDPESGTIRPVAGFDRTKHIDPAWSADGAALYFVSDRNGISDIYRVTLATGELRQLTHLVTGVSGITPLSPAFSVARSNDRLVFSAYEKGSYNLYRLEGAAALAGEAPRPRASVDAGRLPPASGEVAAAPTPVQADTVGFRRRPYRARLSLDHVSQVSLGVAGGSSGVGVVGGAALVWSDMLGDHTLATAVQTVGAGGSVWNNTAFLVGYQNLKSRWNWGLQATQIPTITSDFVQDIVMLQGQPALREREYRFWQIDRSLLAGVAYPFDRFLRLELSGGLRRISFASQVETRVYDVNGQLVERSTVDLPDDPSLALGTGGLALVSDRSVFGGTGPVLGHRYRIGVDQVVGSLRFAEVLGDYRRYVPLARPLTLAGRVLHFGRYGADAEDPRLAPLFIGYSSLVRGYDSGSFLRAECTPVPGDPNACPAFDRLLGSRIGVANVEARLALLGPLGVIPSAGVPPVEMALFFDAGSAWTRAQKASFLGGGASTVSSYGTAMRLNLFGFAVGEVAYVHPNDRPLKGWHWQFSIQPGF